MRYFLYLLHIILLLNVGCHQSVTKPTYNQSEKQVLANAIRKKVALKLKKKTELIPSGIAGQMMHEVKMLGLSFDYKKPITMEKGRELLVTVVQELLNEVNASEQIRPYLDSYPFQSKNVQVRIFLKKPARNCSNSEQLVVITAIEGVFKYKIDDPDNPKRLKVIYQETYEEALQKLEDMNIFLLK